MIKTQNLTQWTLCIILLMAAQMASAKSITVSYVNALGNNVTSTQSSVSNAENVLNPNASTHYSGTIDLNNCEWSLGATVELYNDQTIMNGTLLATSAMNSSDMIDVVGVNVIISDIILDRDITTVPGTLGSGIDLAGNGTTPTSNLRIDGIQIYRQKYGIYTSETTLYPSFIIIYDFFMSGLTDGGVNLNPSGAGSSWGMNGLAIRQGEIQYTDGIGIDLKTIDSVSEAALRAGAGISRIEAVHIIRNGNVGIRLEGSNINVSDALIQDNEGHGIQLVDCKYINLVHNRIMKSGTAIAMPTSGNFFDTGASNGWTVDHDNMVNGKAGIYLSVDSKNVSVINNESFYNSTYGLYSNLYDVSNGSHVLNWNISNNRFHTNGQYSGSNGKGIYLFNWNYGTYKNIRLIGNRCYNDQSIEATTPQAYGLHIPFNYSFAFDKCIAANNDFYDSGQSNTTSFNNWTFDNNLN